MAETTQQQAQQTYKSIDPLDVGATKEAPAPFIDPNQSKGGKGEVPERKADTFTGEAGKLIATAPQQPSTQQDINAILGPYINQMMQLGPEYQQEMEYLKPYLSPEYTGAPTSTYTGPDANLVNQDQAALGKSEAALGQAVENQPPPQFGKVANEMQQYEQSIPYQEALQAGLGYQKYLETYGGLGANTSAWPAPVQQAYQAIGGGASASSSGLPTVGQAAAANNANKLLNTANTTGSSAGGSTSGG
jgi:hypothetical protein